MHDDRAMCNASPMPNQPPSLIGSREVCQILSINRATLSRWVQQGRVAPIGKLPGKNGAFVFSEKAIAKAQANAA